VNKDTELEAFYAVFGKDNDFAILAYERPDILVLANENVVLGVEITEIYSHESDAKLKNLDGYAVGIIKGTKRIHKSDSDVISVDQASILDDSGNEKDAFKAIFKKMPSLKESVVILESAITKKEDKTDKYLLSCPRIDLIIEDSSHLFGYECFEEFYRPFSALFKRELISKSKFREIYLCTRRRENEKIFLPLKGNLFLSDCFAYETIIKNDGFKETYPELTFKLLLSALYLGGHTELRISNANGSVIFRFGPWELQYSASGKNIHDMKLNFDESEFEELETIASTFTGEIIRKAKHLVEVRKTVFAAIELAFNVKEH